MPKMLLPFEQDFARAYCNPSTMNKSSIERSLSDTSAELATLTEEIELLRCKGILICIKVEIPVKVHPHPYDDDGDHPSGLTYKNHVDVMADIYESYTQWRHAEFYMNLAGIELLQDLSGLWANDTEQLEAPNHNSLILAMKDAQIADYLGDSYNVFRLVRGIQRS
ncbi:hypothetical protein CPB85DRAFT_1261118 [Mucidula mucida]|nr:hypothetical protein CPB85DRAFT_1261118 [Mucidula mucida]